MSIKFSAQSGDFGVFDEMKVKKWLTEVISKREMKVGNVNYFFCDDEYLIEVNRKYLEHDTYTDIITFDYVAGNLVSGDILISVERVGENAKIFGVEYDEELRRVIVHGVLHLLGQGDKTEEEAAEMRRLENEALGMWKDMFRVEQ